jgi:hypothetical protein
VLEGVDLGEFLRFWVWAFIAHKVGWTLVNRVVERRNMINVYLRGELALRVLGGVDSEGVI